ncbi:hypothetical protein ABZ471_45725 [Streptomyces sp. NPDC005728]|uniref:hypothetical protein n=1 Tax=Streptomyces sp. NPDC005728 TaxID=3157054 RepID=UPI0033C1544C
MIRLPSSHAAITAPLVACDTWFGTQISVKAQFKLGDSVEAGVEAAFQYQWLNKKLSTHRTRRCGPSSEAIYRAPFAGYLGRRDT